MKAIVFDVDGVIIISAKEKDNLIRGVLQEHKLYDIEGVKEILALSLNRVILLEKIHEIISFDREKVLYDINTQLEELENNPVGNNGVVDFIRSNYREYIFFTNTSLPREGLKRTLNALGIMECFKELLAGEDGTKLENINYIMEEYSLLPEETLFIDDTFSHVEKVGVSGVHTLYFDSLDIDIEDKLKEY